MVYFYRTAHFFSVNRKNNLFWYILGSMYIYIYKLITEFLLGYEIPAATKIGKDFIIDHGYGVVINKHCIIGDNFRIKHGVTIGCKTMPDGSQGASPTIGNNVDIGANAVIIGDVEVGDNVKIGAGAVVVKTVPSNCLVVGNPGRIIELF